MFPLCAGFCEAELTHPPPEAASPGMGAAVPSVPDCTHSMLPLWTGFCGAELFNGRGAEAAHCIGGMPRAQQLGLKDDQGSAGQNSVMCTEL